MLIEFLKEVPDPRDPQGREYKLWEVLLVSMLGILSNAKGYKDIERFATARFEALKEHFGIKWKRVPDYTAIRKILVRIEPADLEKALRKQAAYQETQGQKREDLGHICFDGKSLNGSFSHVKDQRAAHVFQAFSALDQIILASEDVGAKTNEIAYFQKMIEDLNVDGLYLTADALHCQKKHLS